MIELFKKSALYRFVFANESLLQFVKFGIVGLSNTAISVLIYYAFLLVDTDLYLWGSFVGWVVSVFNAFYWGNKVVFKAKAGEKRSILKPLLKSYATYGATFLLTQVLLIVEVSVFHLSEWIVPFINLIITIPLNFIINKFWTFRGNNGE